MGETATVNRFANVNKPVDNSFLIARILITMGNNDCVFIGVKKIDHLPLQEQRHFIQCDCGAYIDMRNLAEVFKHFHSRVLPDPGWTHAVRAGEPVAYTKSNKKIDLN